MIKFVPKAEAFALHLDEVAGSGSRVLVFDDGRALSGVVMRLTTETLIADRARAACLLDSGMDLRTATTLACGEQAQVLARGRPFVAAFPRIITHAQAQLAIELGQRGIDVMVGAECAAFAQLVDEPLATE
jgi:hypothetical protein